MIKAVPRAQKDIPLEGIESVLLANECIVCKAFAFLETRGLSEKGVVCVTNLHILLISKQQTPLRSSRGLNSSASIFERIPLGVIDTLTERKTTHTASPNGPAAPTNPSLRVVCKDGRICDFLLGSNEDAERLYHHIYTFAFPGSISKLFAFYNRPNKSARKIVDFYPEQQESDDEDDDPLPPPPPPPATLPLDRGSSEDLSSTTGMTDTEDGDWDEDEFDTDFMMYDGWDVYHPKREFLRLGVRVNGREKRKKLPRYLRDQLKQDSSNLVNSPIYRSQWRLSKVNRSYQLSETYPRYLAVPRLITDQELLNSRNLRNLNRIPTLCYLHPETYAAICRASQLFVGLHGPRNPNDEKFLALVRSCGLNPNASVFILDCRPEKNTRGGRGCENLRYYQYCEYEYLGVRSLKKLKNKIESVWSLARICQEEVATHHQRNEKITVAIIDALRDPRAIEWVLTLKQIIRASRRIVQLVQQGSSVIVHCPQGRDRSPLAISLAMLQLDPFHRTIEGFEILVEKEWSSAGHQFQTRCGHGIENPGRDPDRVPLFVIFLDCVWQLLRQHPDSFEFNEESLYSCRFGTFLYDCEKERKESDVFGKTCSLWSFTNCNTRFLNPRYRQLMSEKTSHYARVSLIHVDCERIQLWLGYFFPQLPPPVVSSVQHWQGNDLSNSSHFGHEDNLQQQITKLEQTQRKLLATIESFKKQNQELYIQNEHLYQQNMELRLKLNNSNLSDGKAPTQVSEESTSDNLR